MRIIDIGRGEHFDWQFNLPMFFLARHRECSMKLTDTSLLEQMHISDVEIQNRMRLLGLDESALDLIAKQRGLIEEEVDGIVNRFYDIQTEVDEIASLIGDTETLSRLRIAQRRYITDLFLGVCDSDYVNNRLRIGMVHKRIGVEPKLYLSAVSTLKDLLFELLSVHLKDKQQLAATLSALDKLFYFDTTLIFDTYIASLVGEIELAKRKTEDYAKSLEQKVAERTRQLEKQTRLDGHTGIYNIRTMHDILHRELAVAQRRSRRLTNSAAELQGPDPRMPYRGSGQSPRCKTYRSTATPGVRSEMRDSNLSAPWCLKSESRAGWGEEQIRSRQQTRSRAPAPPLSRSLPGCPVPAPFPVRHRDCPVPAQWRCASSIRFLAVPLSARRALRSGCCCD